MPFLSAAKWTARLLAVIAAVALPSSFAGAQTLPPTAPAVWSDTSMPWSLMPSGEPVAALPQAISISPVAYTYSARSERIDFFGKSQPAIIRLTVQVQSGSVGLLLVTPDGAAQLSKEAALQASPVDVQIYFRVRPATQPSIIVMRNYNAQGQAGLIQLKGVNFIREGDLSTDELADIVKKGLY